MNRDNDDYNYPYYLPESAATFSGVPIRAHGLDDPALHAFLARDLEYRRRVMLTHVTRDAPPQEIALAYFHEQRYNLEVVVSTIFYGRNEGYDRDKPLTYETILFLQGHPLDASMRLAATRPDAMHHHFQYIRWCQDLFQQGTDLSDWADHLPNEESDGGA